MGRCLAGASRRAEGAGGLTSALAISAVFLVLLLASDIAVTYRRNRRAIEHMRTQHPLLPAFEMLAELATMPSEREDEDAA